ncbi:coiled-coil domain-containing protein 90B, mitochondrial-like [Dysidea avara]|uniref:coiled-coil domain-containing protein 90B, mitochondrial-like n=1 Tax=Dysidea avara TaxID=196820 RepID=UPI0033340690
MSGLTRISTSVLSVRCKYLPNHHVIDPWRLLRYKTTTQAPPTLDDILHMKISDSISPLKGVSTPPSRGQDDITQSDVSKPHQTVSNTNPPPHRGHDDTSLADITKPVPFNTHQLVCRLQAKGYSLDQSEELVEVLLMVIQESVATGMGGCVKKSTMDKLEISIRGDIDNVRRDQLLLEKTEIVGIKSDVKKMDAEVHKLMEVLKEEVNKVRSGMSLDINLERSRVKEEYGELQQRIKDAQNRISTEVADLKTMIASQKSDILSSITNRTLTMCAIVLSLVVGIWRLTK